MANDWKSRAVREEKTSDWKGRSISVSTSGESKTLLDNLESGANSASRLIRSVGDKVSSAIEPALRSAQPYIQSQVGSPQSLLQEGLSLSQRVAGWAGEVISDDLAKKGVDPRISAGVGAFTQISPDIALSGGVPVSNTGTSIFRKVGSPLVRKGIRGFIGVPEEAQKLRFNNPEAIKSAPDFLTQGEQLASSANRVEGRVKANISKYPTFNDIGKSVAESMNKLKKNISRLDDKAWGSLLRLKSEPRSRIIKFIEDAKREFLVSGGGTVGRADKMAVSTLDDIISDVKRINQKGIDPKLEQMLDQKQIRKIVQALDDNINWNDPFATETNKALIKSRMGIIEYVKNENPRFAPILDKLAERTKLMKEAANDFSLAEMKGEFQPSNTTASRIKTSLSDTRAESQDLAKRLLKRTKVDIQGQGKKAQFRETFESGKLDPTGAPDRYIGSDIRRLNRVKKAFGLERDAEGFSASDRTRDALRRVNQEKYVKSRGLLKDFDKSQGTKILDKAKSRATLEEFTKERTQGSRRGLAGLALGTAIDAALPGGQGLLTSGLVGAGIATDVYGGRIAGKLIDNLSRLNKSFAGPILSGGGNRAITGLASLSGERLLTESKALEFLREANNDPNEARKMAREAGYKITD